MARKKKHCVDYFPHDTQQNKSVRIISRQYGNDGYAFYYKLRELLGGHRGGHTPRIRLITTLVCMDYIIFCNLELETLWLR